MQQQTRVIRDYIIRGTIGEGSSSRVYEAVHARTGLPVAIKAISKDFIIADPENRTRTMREVEVLKKADHPYIAKFYDYFEDSSYEYLVEELGTSGTLIDYANTQTISEDEARKFFVQILSAIEYVHTTLHIVHRDIKAENILLDKNLNTRLIDFGLCNTSQNGMLLTSCGSLCYASPEIVAGRPYSTPTDIWSLGVLLFALAVGTLPFYDTNQRRLTQKILYGQPVIPPMVSDELADLLTKLLMKDPSERATIKQIKEHPWVRDHVLDAQIRMCQSAAGSLSDENSVETAIRRRVRVTDILSMPVTSVEHQRRMRLITRSMGEIEHSPLPRKATMNPEDSRVTMGRLATRLLFPRVRATTNFP